MLNIRKVIDNAPRINDRVMELGYTEVLVGFPEKTTNREDRLFKQAMRAKAGSPQRERLTKAWIAEGGSDNEMTNASLAFIHDQGSPANNIPARPFMRPGVKDKQKQIAEYLRQAGEYVLDGDKTRAQKAFTAAGLVAQAGIRARITSNIPPPLKKGTLRRRLKMGFVGTNTLVVTGQLRNAVNFIVNKVKGSS